MSKKKKKQITNKKKKNANFTPLQSTCAIKGPPGPQYLWSPPNCFEQPFASYSNPSLSTPYYTSFFNNDNPKVIGSLAPNAQNCVLPQCVNDTLITSWNNE